MFPFSPWASPTGSFQIPVTPPAPAGGSCSTLSVQFPTEWLPFIVGALQQLTLQSTWKGTKADIQAAQAEAANIIASIQAAVCVTEPQPSGGICCGGDDFMASCGCFRQQGDELQMYCCGEWTTIFKVGTGTPSAGQPQPEPNGGTQSVCLDLIANMSVPLGINVSTGDTLLLSNLAGTWRDITSLLGIVNCPDGYIYLEGACFADVPSGSPDPVPTALHMGIIAYIDGTAYDVTGVGPVQKDPVLFTVPGGISNKPVFFQANIANLANAAGNVSFCVDVTNHQAGTWSKTFDFTANPGGWVAEPASGSGIAGAWTPGVGWEPTDVFDTGGNLHRDLQIHIDVTAFNPTNVSYIYDLTLGSFALGSSAVSVIDTQNGGIHNIYSLNAASAVNGTNLGAGGGASATAQTRVQLILQVADPGNSGPGSGSGVIKSCTITGTGPEPVW